VETALGSLSSCLGWVMMTELPDLRFADDHDIHHPNRYWSYEIGRKPFAPKGGRQNIWILRILTLAAINPLLPMNLQTATDIGHE
jgi:hypothetical protein